MDYTFVIIDDDAACRRMLTQIIEKENLGEVVAEFVDGRGDITGKIIQERPDIILIDLLMPGEDGIEIARKLQKRSFLGKIIMISQVENKEMVAQAYSVGIEFYITKPINRIEVLSVLGKVMERIEMQRSFIRVRSSLEALDNINNLSKSFSPGDPAPLARPAQQQGDDKPIRNRTMEVLSSLGIIGEPGSYDLAQIMIFLSSVPDTEKYLGQFRHLKDLYYAVQQKYLKGYYKESTEVRTIEQRIRRATKHAMENVAALGLEDYYNPYFERYGSKFFDFNELRQKMKELKENKKEASRTRVNIKQFINALYMEIQTERD
ncbi:response regulator [candidate division NPL-UPA2 bacterium]|nr:response regulator [candidate division NPL-UPA2 bacterium]